MLRGEILQMVMDIAAARQRQFEAQRLEAVKQWASDPQNSQHLAHIQRELERVAPQRPAAQRPAPAPAVELPRIGFSNRLIDPKVR